MSKGSKIVKKQDFKKLKLKKDIEELVNSDGEPIEGGDITHNSSQIKTAPQQTTDDFVKTSRQHNTYAYSMFGAGGTPYSHGQRTGNSPLSNLEEMAKEKMEKMVEDILSKSNNQDNMLKKRGMTDEISNIPSIDDLKVNKPDVVRVCNEFIKSIEKNALTGSEIVTILGDILNKVSDKIPSQYRPQLKNKI